MTAAWANPARAQGAMRGSIVGGTPLIAAKFPTQQSHFLAASRHGSDERNPAVGSGHQVKEADMAAASILLSRQSQRLLQIGVALLLLLSLEGFAIPHLAAPHLGVSAQRDPTYGPSHGGLEVAFSREMSSHR